MPTATKKVTPAGYLTLKEVTTRTVNGDSFVHLAGTVLSAWEVDDFVKGKIDEGSYHYRSLYEPLTEKEVFDRRAKATAVEGDRNVEGTAVSPPWPDFVGLHPEEIIERMQKSTSSVEVELVRKYERGGLNRQPIVNYVAPIERPPFHGYDDINVRDLLEKLEVLSDDAVAEVKTYEFGHGKRPAILEFEKEST